MRVWRLVKTKHAATAAAGEGARLFPGRWNPRGVPMVYTAQSRSLAVLELLVHLEPGDISDFSILSADVPDGLIESFDPVKIDRDWQHKPDLLRQYGAQWAGSNRSVGLRVPSAIISEEDNVLLNPRHPSFSKVVFSEPEEFRFDPRLRR